MNPRTITIWIVVLFIGSTMAGNSPVLAGETSDELLDVVSDAAQQRESAAKSIKISAEITRWLGHDEDDSKAEEEWTEHQDVYWDGRENERCERTIVDRSELLAGQSSTEQLDHEVLIYNDGSGGISWRPIDLQATISRRNPVRAMGTPLSTLTILGKQDSEFFRTVRSLDPEDWSVSRDEAVPELIHLEAILIQKRTTIHAVFDGSIGYRPVEVASFDLDGNLTKRRIVEFGDADDASDSAFWPIGAETQWYDADSGELTESYALSIESVQEFPNGFDDEIFWPTFPAGTRVVDKVLEVEYLVGGVSREVYSELAGVLQQEIEALGRIDGNGVGLAKASEWREFMNVLAAAGVGFFLLGLWLRRKHLNHSMRMARELNALTG
jgi:hypothetical protein